METKPLMISQSLIKAFYDYNQQKLCGLLFEAKYIKKLPIEQEPSEAMKAGIYFEYLATGALPKSKQVPQPDMAYAGTKRERLAAPYERANKSAELFRKILAHYNIKILKVGYYLTDGEIDGVVDIFAEWNGEKVFIDLKYSGLIEDKWNEMGWELESLPMKDSIMIQGVHYKLLAQRVLGIEDIPFYYFVFDSGNPDNARIIKQNVDEDKKASHVVVISNVKNRLSIAIKSGFTAFPSLKSCGNCPLKDNCPKAISVPLIDEVYY